MAEKIQKAFEARVNKLIRDKNKDILGILRARSYSEALTNPLYREKEGYRNGLIYAKQILREVMEAENSSVHTS
jgi:hypothetical protein